MRVFALGGAGTYGLPTAQKLVASDIVSEIVIAGRNMEAAIKAASGLGSKATAVQADVGDERQLASLLADSDIMVNTAGPEFKVVLPALRAAIEAGVDYCDLCADGRTREKAIELDSSAKASGVTALVGIGMAGLSNLMMIHAAHQLDQAEELRFCMFVVPSTYGEGGPKAFLEQMRKAGHADASWQEMINQVAGKVRLYRDGRWIDVDPIKDGVRITLPQGREVTAYPAGLSEPITLPRTLPGIRSVSVLVSYHPPQLNEVFCGLGGRVARGELNESAAAISFFEHMVTLPAESLAPPEGYESGWVWWIEGIGKKQNKRMCYKCWPNGDWAWTTPPLATAALKILRGEIQAKGILSPESCLDPMPFFAEVAQYATERPSDSKLLAESMEPLDHR